MDGVPSRRQRMRVVVKRAVSALVSVLARSAVGSVVAREAARTAMERVAQVSHQGLTLRFTVPNALSQYRADSFATKEPETLRWIDEFPTGSILWDIGANVGLYSCYAAKRAGCTVIAFEPSVFNLESLARNVWLNEVSARVTIVPLPLSDTLMTSTLNMATTEWGGALSTFGRDYGYDGQPLIKVFDYRTIGLSMTDAVAVLKLPQPDFIKMDVDGLEHVILRGGADVLKHVKSVLIEINDAFVQQAQDAKELLELAGLTFREKQHSAIVEDSPFRSAYNQIWVRTGARNDTLGVSRDDHADLRR
jgi:FkbM family methyltransferase